MAQNFATSPQVIYDTLTGDAEFMGYLGEYVFVANNTTLPSITIATPGADLPSLESQSGLEVIIHDAADFDRRNFLTDDSDLRATWKLFLIVREPATGTTMTNAVKRIMEIFGFATSIETVAATDGLKALAQTMVMIPSDSPIL